MKHLLNLRKNKMKRVNCVKVKKCILIPDNQLFVCITTMQSMEFIMTK